jgi:hypothetical protein
MSQLLLMIAREQAQNAAWEAHCNDVPMTWVAA